jgi:hypothetical protein
MAPCNSIKLPSGEQVEALWNNCGVLPNIRRHCLRVCQAALFLWRRLHTAGYCLNRDAVKMGALLHDLAKAHCLDKPWLLHEQEGRRILQALGYPELGYLVERHVHFTAGRELDEAALIYYADKRVLDDKIVSLSRRFIYIAERYGRGMDEYMQKIRRQEANAREVEKQIANLAPGFNPDELLNEEALCRL